MAEEEAGSAEQVRARGSAGWACSRRWSAQTTAPHCRSSLPPASCVHAQAEKSIVRTAVETVSATAEDLKVWQAALGRPCRHTHLPVRHDRDSGGAVHALPCTPSSSCRPCWRACRRRLRRARSTRTPTIPGCVACSLQCSRTPVPSTLPEGARALVPRAERGAATALLPAALPQVHSGFLSAFDSVRPAVLGLLGAMLAGQRQPWRLFISAHAGLGRDG